ncbi:hypothetical protein [Denitromonas iodatirespirans]|uniref:Uncharacterized protein n=1 Tax=Denitromonas iodatirespirans TaxID=2795389 RepID=A0A944DDJ3_DENI1|nr:hypothetical protein [Denitromonas iodatirespirans]MBT0963076.1 hypothetical protein [Denitromonas iodatirespirans]
MSALYSIVFSGDLRDGFAPEQVKARFAARFALKPAQLAQMFSGREITLKKGLSADQARRYVAELEAMGLQAHARAVGGAEPVAPPKPAATEAGYRIVFAGKVLPGFSREAVMRASASRLHFDARQQAMLFSGKRVTMKRGLSEEKARSYLTTLRHMGMDVATDPALPRPAPVETSAHDEATEASLMETQFTPAAPYNFENTFHSSSSLDMLRSDDDDLPPLPDPANPALGHARSAMMQTIINPEAMRDYEAALADDPELSALREAHDAPAPAPRRVPSTPVDFDFTAPPVSRPVPPPTATEPPKPAPEPQPVPPSEPPAPQAPAAVLAPLDDRLATQTPPEPPARTSRTGTLIAVLAVAVLVALALFYLGGG